MTQPTNTFDTYDSVGNREDLINKIYNIAPTETPATTMMGKAKATATLYEWQTDTLAAATNNKQIQGDNVTLDATVPTVRLGNYTQISSKSVVISGTLEAVTRAGRKREMAYQMAQRARELKRDIETTIIGTNQAKAVGNSTTASACATMLSWVTNDSNGGGAAADPTGDGSDTRTNGTQRAFTESLLQDVIQLVFTAGGNPGVIMVGPFNKRKMSSFQGNSTRMVDADSKSLFAAIDVYHSDFGTLKVFPNRFQRERDAWVLDMEFWKLVFLRPFQSWEIGKTGDNEQRQLLTEFTLQASQQLSSGIVADLTTS